MTNQQHDGPVLDQYAAMSRSMTRFRRSLGLKDARRLALIAIVMSGGCHSAPTPNSTAAVTLTPLVIRGQKVLLSEVVEASNPADLVESRFKVQNTSDQSSTVTLVGKSCSCYEVHRDGELLAVDDSFNIAPQATHELRLLVKPPRQPGEPSWRFNLLVDGIDTKAETDTGTEDTGTEKEAYGLNASLSIHVVDDIRLSPDVLTMPLQQAEPASSEGSIKPLRVTRTWRGELEQASALLPPQLLGLPDGIVVEEFHQASPPRKIDSTLYEQEWTTSVRLTPDFAASSGLYPFDVRFAPLFANNTREKIDDTGDAALMRTGQLLIEARRGVVAPKLVHLGRIPDGQSRHRRVVLSSDDGRAFQITAVEVRPPDESVALADTSSLPLLVSYDVPHVGLSHAVELTLNSPSDTTVSTSDETATTTKFAQSQHCLIRLTTDHPTRPAVEFEVHWIRLARQE